MQNEILKMNICNSNTRYLWTCWLKMQFCARTSEKVIHPKGASCSFFSLPLIERFSQSCIYWLALCLQIHGNSASVNWSRCFQAVIFLPVSPQMPSFPPTGASSWPTCVPPGSILELCLKPHYVDNYVCFLSQIRDKPMTADVSFWIKKRVTLQSYFVNLYLQMLTHLPENFP